MPHSSPANLLQVQLSTENIPGILPAIGVLRCGGGQWERTLLDASTKRVSSVLLSAGARAAKAVNDRLKLFDISYSLINVRFLRTRKRKCVGKLRYVLGMILPVATGGRTLDALESSQQVY